MSFTNDTKHACKVARDCCHNPVLYVLCVLNGKLLRKLKRRSDISSLRKLWFVYRYHKRRHLWKLHIWSFNIMCKQQQRAAVNPFSNGTKNGDFDGTCKRAFTNHCLMPFSPSKLMCLKFVRKNLRSRKLPSFSSPRGCCNFPFEAHTFTQYNVQICTERTRRNWSGGTGREKY